MARQNSKEASWEIESLNLDDLDVEELEHRLEMTVVPKLLPADQPDDGGGGGGGTSCDTYVCGALCGALCGCNSLDACGIDLY